MSAFTRRRVISAVGGGVTLPPTAVSVRGFDTVHTILEQSWFNDRYAEGFRLYVLHSTEWGGTAPWWRTTAQLEMALTAGIKVAAYNRDPTTWEAGINACGAFIDQLQYFALDVELIGADGGPGKPITRAMVDGITAMGVRPVVYSGSGMWSQVQGSDTTEFSDVSLWDTNAAFPPADLASWTADIDQPTPVVYGGWNTPNNPRMIVQQAFEFQLGGIAVDLNSVRSSFLIDK